MGYDFRRIKTISHQLLHPEVFGVRQAGIRVSSDWCDTTNLLDPANKSRYLDFLPHPGWVGSIEVD
jgi:hypothetical protein